MGYSVICSKQCYWKEEVWEDKCRTKWVIIIECNWWKAGVYQTILFILENVWKIP